MPFESKLANPQQLTQLQLPRHRSPAQAAARRGAGSATCGALFRAPRHAQLRTRRAHLPTALRTAATTSLTCTIVSASSCAA